jgi:tungstate transport system substrate-binding protein
MRCRLPLSKILLVSLFLAAVFAPLKAQTADHPFITVASTTSTEQSGLLGYLLPEFTRMRGIEVLVVAVGTGQALKIGELGECDVVLAHDKGRELQFMQNGFGSVRREVMYNDFVIVGPEDDPAQISATNDAVAALRRIAAAKARFVSRGDMSGTDAVEQRLWADAGGPPIAARDLWYVKTGSGMAQTLTTAASTHGYALTDRSTWVRFRNRGTLKIVVDRDPRLFNQYAVMLVNPARHPGVKAALGMAFIDWLTSRHGQDAIASYKIDGEQLFFPNYAGW